MLQVYDLRQAARVLHSIPFNAGPALLCWHPLSSALLLAVGPSGSFMIADAQGGMPQEGGQVRLLSWFRARFYSFQGGLRTALLAPAEQRSAAGCGPQRQLHDIRRFRAVCHKRAVRCDSCLLVT